MRIIAKLCLVCTVSAYLLSAQTVVRRVPATNPQRTSPQTKGTTPQTNPRPDTGTLDGLDYTNEYFAFRYKIPEGLADFQLHLQRTDAQANTFVLISVSGPSGRTLVIMADNAAYYNGLRDGNAYLRKVTRAMLEMGFQVLREATEYSYDGQKFFRSDYKKASVYQSAVFTVRSGYALGLTAAAATPEQVDELCGSLSSLEFFGPERPPERIIPFEVSNEPPPRPVPAPAAGQVYVSPPTEVAQLDKRRGARRGLP